MVIMIFFIVFNGHKCYKRLVEVEGDSSGCGGGLVAGGLAGGSQASRQGWWGMHVSHWIEIQWLTAHVLPKDGHV